MSTLIGAVFQANPTVRARVHPDLGSDTVQPGSGKHSRGLAAREFRNKAIKESAVLDV